MPLCEHTVFISVCAHGLLTRVRSCHFEMISHNFDTSDVRPCDGDVNFYFDNNYDVGDKSELRLSTCHSDCET